MISLDGSKLALDNASPLRKHFGCSGSKKDATTALASLCYDPLNNVILDAGLYPCLTSEHDAAKANIKAVEALPKPSKIKNLYIFDRGYPSKEFFAEFIDSELTFLMRVRRKFNLDFDLVSEQETVTFSYGSKAYTVRVFKVPLETGETETIVTNLPAEHLKRCEVKELYFKRWCIETKYNSLKNKLELENMSGRRPVTVYQDFWAKPDLANTMAALEFATNESIAHKTSDSNNKYKQTTNENRLISHFSKRYAELLAYPDTDHRLALFEELVEDISIYPVEIKPGRSFSRKTPRKMKFCDRIKRVLR